MAIELSYGFMSNALGLVSHGFHLGFDCIMLTLSLMAMSLSKKKPTHRFSYGFDRFEVFAAFTNGCILLFISTFLAFESLHRISQYIFLLISASTTISASSKGIGVNSVKLGSYPKIAFCGVLLNILEILFLKAYVTRSLGWAGFSFTHLYLPNKF